MIVSPRCLSRGCDAANRLHRLSTHSPIKTPGTGPGASPDVDNWFRRQGRQQDHHPDLQVLHPRGPACHRGVAV